MMAGRLGVFCNTRGNNNNVFKRYLWCCGYISRCKPCHQYKTVMVELHDGRALNGQRAFTKWGSNGDGVGGWGTKSDSWGDLGVLMVPGFRGRSWWNG